MLWAAQVAGSLRRRRAGDSVAEEREWARPGSGHRRLPGAAFVVCGSAVSSCRPKMFRSLLSTPLFVFLVAACGQSPSQACPADDQEQCADAGLSYDGGIGDLLKERCSPCHAPGGVEATRLLTDYGHVSGERMSIVAQLVTCSMPPAGAPALSADEQKQILGWLACGAPR